MSVADWSLTGRFPNGRIRIKSGYFNFERLYKKVSYENFLYIAIRAALDAGKRIMDIYDDPASDFGIERKADNSPLTKADKAAHGLIAAALSATPFPTLSEEGRDIPYAERSAWETLWIVDPLDGTKEFLKRNGEFTVNIALVADGSPVMGVIYVPVRRTLCFGIVGEGAWRLGQCPAALPDSWEGLTAASERLPERGDREGFVVVASRSHLSPETSNFIDRLRATHGNVTLCSAGSSLKLCLVAEGRADVYPRMAPTMEWDTAAGDAIVRAAGGRTVRADDGEPLIYNKEDLHNPWFVVYPA